MKQITIAIICFIVLSVLTVMGAFQYAEENEISQTNKKLAELKIDHGVKRLSLEDPEVKKILDEEVSKGAREMKEALKSGFGLVGIYAFLLMLYILRVRKKRAYAP